MGSTYYDNLIKTVLDCSFANDWSSAVEEWVITDWDEDEDQMSTCVCGKEGLKYLFEIENIKTKKKLFPIGSNCIKKFKRDDLTKLTTIKEGLFTLFHAIENNERIELNSNYFTKNILKYLYEAGCFKGNSYEAKKSYDFMLKMFNQRKEPTDKQKKYINGLIAYEIKPFLKNDLY